MRTPPRSAAWPLAIGLAWLLVAMPAAAQDDRWPPRVGRIADLDGLSWTWDADEREWVSAWRNRPLAEGDRLAVSDGGRAELQFGRSVVRLGGGSELELLALDDARIVLQLHGGALAWRLHGAEEARQAELRTAEGSVRPLAAGHFRVDRGAGGPTWVGVWQGRAEFVGGGNLLHLDAGERVELRAAGGGVRTRVAAMPRDDFGSWARADAGRGAAESWRHVPPGVPGVDELDRHGRWDRHPEHGAVWLPHALPVGWTPFSHGRWVWLRPWGWTWVDAMPWGFAPFHYGRWLQWGGRWVWWPGPYGAAPIFQPALVAWVGGSGVSIGITIGHGVRPPPPRAWVPLHPHQPYVPIVRPPPRHPAPPYYRLPPPPPREGRPPRHVHPVPPPRQVQPAPHAHHVQPAPPARRVQPMPPPYTRHAVTPPAAVAPPALLPRGRPPAAEPPPHHVQPRAAAPQGPSAHVRGGPPAAASPQAPAATSVEREREVPHVQRPDASAAESAAGVARPRMEPPADGAPAPGRGRPDQGRSPMMLR